MSNKKANLKSKITSNLNKVQGINPDKVNSFKSKEAFTIEYIDIDKIIINKHNFYPVENVDELAEDIRQNGLLHNILVRKIGDKYEIISGERRFTALSKLRNEGMEEYKKIPCKVTNIDDVQSMIMLIQANAQSREISEPVKLKQIKLLHDLYAEQKQDKKVLNKDIQAKIAEDLDMSISQVKKYNAINKGSKELQDAFENEKLNFSEATSVARLSDEGQKAVVEVVNNSNDKIDVEEMKSDIKNIEKQKKNNELTEEEFKKQLDVVKEKYVKTGKAEEINDKLSKSVLNATVKKKLNNLIKGIEKVTFDISNLDEINDVVIKTYADLENAVEGLKEEIGRVQENAFEDLNEESEVAQ